MSYIKYFLRISRVRINIQAETGYDTELLAYYVIVPHKDVPTVLCTSTNYFDRTRNRHCQRMNFQSKATARIVQNNNLALTRKRRRYVDTLQACLFKP